MLRLETIGLVTLCGAVLISCTENTAGVFTETESGQQASINEDGEKVVNINDCSSTVPSNLKKAIAIETNCISYDRDYAMTDVQGTVTDKNGTPIKSARVLLKRLENNYSIVEGIKRETKTDENGNYTFKDVVYKTTYKNTDPLETIDFSLNKKGQADIYYDFTLQVESEDKSIASYAALDLKNAEKVTENKSVIRKMERQELRSTASAEITFDPSFFSEGNKVCLDYSFTCYRLTAEDIASGSFVMKNIPEGAYQNLCWNKTETDDRSGMECHPLSTPVVTSKTSNPTYFKLTEEAILLLDSLKDKTLPAVIVPVTLPKDGVGKLLVSNNSISKLTSIDPSTTRYWAEATFDSSTASYSLAEGSEVGIGSRILYAAAYVQNDSILKNHNYLQKNNIGYSFKFSLDGSNKTLTEPLFSTVATLWDNTRSGIEIAQCEAMSSSLCLRVYNHTDSDTTATEIAFESKSNLLDGKTHQIAFALAGNHLTVAVDGIIIRNTDLKLQDFFGDYNTYRDFIQVGEAQLQDFVVFRMNSDIHQDKDTGWNRLKAWLITHQTLDIAF